MRHSFRSFCTFACVALTIGAGLIPAEPAAAALKPTKTAAKTGAKTSGGAGMTRRVCGVYRAATSSAQWGTFDRPFAADSPWNSVPQIPVFGSATIPTSLYYPAVSSGNYSTQAFLAADTDPAVTVRGTTDSGVWDPDAEVYRSKIVIPHWPAGVTPATGSDGHAEIVDLSTGLVHSFWQLKLVSGKWQAQQYAWTALAGRGFGDPSHYMQGARSSGTSTLGGLIRTAEISDGDSVYRHALAMSLTNNALASSPAYIFPATSNDSDAATANSGSIPLGALVMLPPTFDADSIANTDLRKVANTLKRSGAYVVDRNSGTPFMIYVENGNDFSLMKNGWDSAVANDLDRIRAALRQVVAVSGWLDGDGNANTGFNTNQNLLSMRGFWYQTVGTTPGTFDTWKQSVVFPTVVGGIEQVNAGGRAFSGVNWAQPTVGTTYRLVAKATGGASLRVMIRSRSTGLTFVDSGLLVNGQTFDFLWPVADAVVVTDVVNSSTGVAGSASANLFAVAGATSATSDCGK